MGDNRTAGVLADRICTPPYQQSNLFGGETAEIQTVAVTECPCRRPHALPAVKVSAPRIAEGFERTVFAFQPLTEQFAGRFAEAVFFGLRSGNIDPLVRFVDRFVGKGTVADVGNDLADKAFFQLLNFLVIGTQPRPAARRSIGTGRRLKSVALAVNITVLRIFADEPFRGSVQVKKEDHPQFLLFCKGEDAFDVIVINDPLADFHHAPDQPDPDRVEAGSGNQFQIFFPTFLPGRSSPQILCAKGKIVHI